MKQFLLAAAADETLEGLGAAGVEAGYADVSDVPTIVGGLINVVLGLTGILFIFLLVYGGILYLTAGGVDDNVKKAKKLISNAVIGIIIIVAAYAITSFLFQALTTATGA
jgi:hypothetical protein